MTSNYPGAVDALSNPDDSDPLNSPNHADQHENANDAIEAIQNTMGTNPHISAAKSKTFTDVNERIEEVEGDVAGQFSDSDLEEYLNVIDESLWSQYDTNFATLTDRRGKWSRFNGGASLSAGSGTAATNWRFGDSQFHNPDYENNSAVDLGSSFDDISNGDTIRAYPFGPPESATSGPNENNYYNLVVSGVVQGGAGNAAYYQINGAETSVGNPDDNADDLWLLVLFNRDLKVLGYEIVHGALMLAGHIDNADNLIVRDGSDFKEWGLETARKNFVGPKTYEVGVGNYTREAGTGLPTAAGRYTYGAGNGGDEIHLYTANASATSRLNEFWRIGQRIEIDGFVMELTGNIRINSGIYSAFFNIVSGARAAAGQVDTINLLADFVSWTDVRDHVRDVDNSSDSKLATEWAVRRAFLESYWSRGASLTRSMVAAFTAATGEARVFAESGNNFLGVEENDDKPMLEAQRVGDFFRITRGAAVLVGEIDAIENPSAPVAGVKFFRYTTLAILTTGNLGTGAGAVIDFPERAPSTPITVSDDAPTSADGINGDIWIEY